MTYEEWTQKFKDEEMEKKEWELRTANGKYLPMTKEEYNLRTNGGKNIPATYKDWYPEREASKKTYQQYVLESGKNPKLSQSEWESRTQNGKFAPMNDDQLKNLQTKQFRDEQQGGSVTDTKQQSITYDTWIRKYKGEPMNE